MEAFGKCLPDRKVWYMYMHTVLSGKELKWMILAPMLCYLSLICSGSNILFLKL